MPKYQIDDHDTGKKYMVEMDGPPSEADIEDILGSQAEKAKPQAAPEVDSRTQYEKNGVVGALFPATASSTERGGNAFSRTIAGAGDALTLPVRAVSGISTGFGTLAGGGTIGEAAQRGMQDLSRTKSEESGVLGFAQNAALDPTSSPLLLGAGNVAKIGKGAATLGKAALRTGLQGAGTGAASSAYQQAEEGKIDPLQTAGQAGIGLGLGALATGAPGLAKKAVGKALQGSALKNIDIALKPGHTGKKLGFLEENVMKHDLGVKPDEVFKNASEKLNVLQARAQELAAESPVKFNVRKQFDDVINSINKKDNAKNNALQKAELIKTRDAFIDAFGEEVDASDAMKIRSQIGKETAFAGRTSAGAKVDPDANWKESIYNDLYHKWKDELHSKLGGELKDINTAQSELIPIEQVADRRNTIATQNNRISLADLGTAGVGAIAGGGAAAASGDDKLSGTAKALALAAALTGARRGFGSSVATKAMYNLGKKLAPEKIAAMGKLGKTAYETGEPITPENADIPTALRKAGGREMVPEERGLPAPMLADGETAIEIVVPARQQRLGSIGQLAEDAPQEIPYRSRAELERITGKQPDKTYAESIADALNRRLGNERGAVGANPQIHTDNFKNWFGDWKKNQDGPLNWMTDDAQSKVVDDIGTPQIVYHGGSGNFNEFNDVYSSGSPAKGTFFFSNKPKIAETYIGKSGANEYNGMKGANIKPAYLDIKNPLEIYADGANWNDIQFRKGQWTTNELAELAKKEGRDGIIIHEVSDVGSGEEQFGTIYGVFSPNKIKSATGNSGAFSKATNNVNGSAAVPMMGLTAAGSLGALTAAALAKRKLDEQKAKRK